jgi:hypothetical protein
MMPDEDEVSFARVFDMEKTRREHSGIEGLFSQLQAQPVHSFPAQGVIVEPETHGVYVVRNAAQAVLHVGRTNRGKRDLAQRLTDHLCGTSSFAKGFLVPRAITLRDGCTYQYLEVDDHRTRALLEHLAIGMLCPEHLGLGRDEQDDDG